MASYIANKPLIMAALALLAVLAIANCIFCAVAARDLSDSGYGEAAMTARHEKWMAEHGRTYRDEAERARRFQVFRENAAFVDRSNAAASRKKYHPAINRFADMTHDEFMARYTGFKPVPATGNKVPGFKYGNVTLSDDQQAVDWRKKGCCWAFSAVAAIEGMHQIKTGELASLSEQQLLDCSTNGNNNGCGDGTMEYAFQYVIGSNSGGIATEAAYPYTATQGMCQNAPLLSPFSPQAFLLRVKGGSSYAATAGSILTAAGSIRVAPTNLPRRCGGGGGIYRPSKSCCSSHGFIASPALSTEITEAPSSASIISHPYGGRRNHTVFNDIPLRRGVQVLSTSWRHCLLLQLLLSKGLFSVAGEDAKFRLSETGLAIILGGNFSLIKTNWMQTGTHVTYAGRKDAADSTMNAYKAAKDIALADLAPTHSIRLGSALSFSVFYYEILNSLDRACNLAK